MSRTLISRPNVEKLVRMADLDLRVEVAGRPRGADRLRSSKTHPAGRQRGGQPLRDHLSRRESRAGEEGRAVAADDLRRIEPRRQAPGHADAPSSSSTTRSSTTKQTLQAAENRLKEFKLEVHGRRRQSAGPGLFRPRREAAATRSRTRAGAAIGRAGARLVQEGARGRDARRSCRSRPSRGRAKPCRRSMRGSLR